MKFTGSSWLKTAPYSVHLFRGKYWVIGSTVEDVDGLRVAKWVTGRARKQEERIVIGFHGCNNRETQLLQDIA